MTKLGKADIRTRGLFRLFRETVGFSVALASIGWVLFHLVGFFFYGYVWVGENNPAILLLEFVLTASGLVCFMITLYEDKMSKSSHR